MNIALWATQILLVVVFGYSALIKGTQSTERAVALGMTGVVNVPLPVMRFTAYSEVLGVIGLIVPYVTGVLPILTPLAAIGLGVIMVLAARIHLGLGERSTAVGNLVLLAMCLSWRGAVGHDESLSSRRFSAQGYECGSHGPIRSSYPALCGETVAGGGEYPFGPYRARSAPACHACPMPRIRGG